MRTLSPRRLAIGAMNSIHRRHCVLCGGRTSVRFAYWRFFAHCEACDFISALDFVPDRIEQGMGLEGSWSGPGGGGFREYFLVRFLREQLGLKRFLLYGTGNTSTLDNLLAEGISVVGADIDSGVVKYKQGVLGSDAFFHVDAIPDSMTFDAIIAVEVFEHLHEPVSSLNNLFNRLALGGVICGTTNFYGGGSIRDANTPGYMSHPGHVAYWSDSSLRNAVRSFGRDSCLFELICPRSVRPDEKYGQLWPTKRVFFIYSPKFHGEFFTELAQTTPILPIDKP